MNDNLPQAHEHMHDGHPHHPLGPRALWGLRLLAVICSHDSADEVFHLFKKAHLPIFYQFRGYGTASSKILDSLGLGETVSSVLICLVPKQLTPAMLRELTARLNLLEPGHGIAFTIPVSGLSNPIMKLLDAETREEIKKRRESEVEKVKNEATHTLIISAVNQGYSEELMDAARSAGATGGTVIPARRPIGDEAIRFWGITFQEEKDIVSILAPKDKKIEIMKAINTACGIQTEAAGIIFSLPVEDVVGLAVKGEFDN